MGPEGQSDIKYPHIYVALVGSNRTVFNLLGRVVAALQAGGVPQNKVDAFFNDASDGDYEHTLCVIAQTVQVRTVDETLQLAEELADGGDKYVPDPRLGICATCDRTLSPDDVLTITSTWRETGNCDGCPREVLPEPFKSIYQDIVEATAPLTGDAHESQAIADCVMAALIRAVKDGMRELVETAQFWRDTLERFDENGLDGDISARAKVAVVGFHAGFTSAYERSFTESLNSLMEHGYVAYLGDGEVRLTEKGEVYARGVRVED